MTGISKQPYDQDFEIAKLLQERESSLRYWNLFLGQGGVSLENGLFWLGISIGLNVCCCVRDRYTSSLLSCTQLTRRPKKAWVVNRLAYFIVEVCVSCARLFSPIRLLLA
jgi:hypothetical protein